MLETSTLKVNKKRIIDLHGLAFAYELHVSCTCRLFYRFEEGAPPAPHRFLSPSFIFFTHHLHPLFPPFYLLIY